ncbi:hypothetical protein [Sediminitomix flava]|nr:hypothetical protein [Sediminitomix flava]
MKKMWIYRIYTSIEEILSLHIEDLWEEFLTNENQIKRHKK